MKSQIMLLRLTVMLVFLALLVFAGGDATAQARLTPPPAPGLQPEQVAVVVNDNDHNSVAVAEYYRNARNIPMQNMVHVRVDYRQRKLSLDAFNHLKAQIEAQLKPNIEAMVLVWTTPYAVECNSLTAALTLGYDADQCKHTCAPGKPSRYFNSKASLPFTELGMRLSMLLPTESFEKAKALIDRGVVSGFRVVPATAYFLSTSDHARNSRAKLFPRSGTIAQKKLTIKTLTQDSLEGVDDIMLYQTGLIRVPHLETLQFIPGALADHLTSYGGDLLGGGQMSSLRWLDAGATASYGTVSEPCSYWQKFPQPAMLLQHYLSGATAIEAYWKSVAWPAQGLFIGEPLAAPYHH
jgi:uncharacterized protein (TIGR03790 family)